MANPTSATVNIPNAKLVAIGQFVHINPDTRSPLKIWHSYYVVNVVLVHPTLNAIKVVNRGWRSPHVTYHSPDAKLLKEKNSAAYKRNRRDGDKHGSQ